MREIYPIPAHIICENCAYLSSAKVVKGAIWCVVWHYWRFGCNELPGDVDIMEIAALRGNDWIRHKARIKKILSDIVPELQKRYEKFDKRAKQRKWIATLGVIAWQKKAQQQRALKGSKSLPLVDELPNSTFVPISSGKECPPNPHYPARRSVTEDKKRFTDKL